MPHVYKRDNSKFYQCRIKTQDGYVRRSTGETTKAKAEKVAETWEAELAIAGGYLLSVAHSVFIETVKLKPNTLKQYDSSFRSIKRVLGDFFLNHLGEEDLKTYIKSRFTECTPARVKRDLAYLSSLYNWATMIEDGPPTNPVRALNQRKLGLKNGKPRKRWLTEPQFEALLAMVSNPLHRALLITAVNTGMRRDELLSLRRTEVFLKRKVIIIGNLDPLDTKGGEGRLIPLSKRVCDTLRDTLQAHPMSEWVFLSSRTGGRLVSIHGWWPALVEKAGLGDFRFHDLRHTFASWASQRGVDERVLQLWMGHKTAGMTRKYSHLRDSDVESALSMFDRSLDDVVLPSGGIGGNSKIDQTQKAGKTGRRVVREGGQDPLPDNSRAPGADEAILSDSGGKGSHTPARAVPRRKEARRRYMESPEAQEARRQSGRRYRAKQKALRETSTQPT